MRAIVRADTSYALRTDAKTVSLLALACFHPHPKVQSSAVRFFLGDLHNSEDGNSSDGSSDEDVIPDVNKMQHQRKINKKTKGGDRKVRAAAAVARRIRREAQDGKGEKDVPVTFGGATFTPGDHLWSDEDGIVVTSAEHASTFLS